MTKCFEKIGKAYFGKEEFAMAVHYYEKAYKLLEDTKDCQEQSRCCKNIAQADYPPTPTIPTTAITPNTPTNEVLH